MRNCSFLLVFLVCAPFAFSQATSTPPPLPAATSSSKAVGPEAVADHDPTRVVATVGGKQITAKQALEMLRPFPPDQRKQYEKNLPKLIEQLYLQKQLADQAAKLNLDQQPIVKERIAMSRETVLAQAYLNHLTEDAAKSPGEDPKHYYDNHPDEFDQAKLSGIFVSFSPPGTPAPASGELGKTEQAAEEKANGIEKKLKAGGDFTALARTESDNQNTASKGGDLGFVSIGDPQMPPALRTALGKLQPGQYSEPVRINGAFLIVKLESRQKRTFPEVQATLTQRLNAEKSQGLVKEELDKYKLKVEDPDFFGTPGTRSIPTLQRPVSAPAQPSPEK